jgi:hypothetical protein
VEYSGPCELSTNGGDFVEGTGHLIARGDVYVVGWYGFIESPTFDWDAVLPSRCVKLRLPSGSVGHITIKNHTAGATLVRVDGRGDPPW